MSLTSRWQQLERGELCVACRDYIRISGVAKLNFMFLGCWAEITLNALTASSIRLRHSLVLLSPHPLSEKRRIIASFENVQHSFRCWGMAHLLSKYFKSCIAAKPPATNNSGTQCHHDGKSGIVRPRLKRFVWPKVTPPKLKLLFRTAVFIAFTAFAVFFRGGEEEKKTKPPVTDQPTERPAIRCWLAVWLTD